ncbi:TonB-dependent receptor [Stenotrophomonas ginsengisoli]|uniref:TonB-dependent receptor n=1 Tax=Stenotrophomonas ginsengisoli TaxID=336566 RepID=A0A0R0DC98_9GAMM|nr:TonB-dependent receptor [Stenotrophomonas ginsengisoli]KRG75220.1 TonB-dependent receptor [Stenotrophomonas ginsengisoli]
MSMKRNKLRDAIVVSLAVGSISVAGMGTALAQEAPADGSSQAQTLDTVKVTGTRLQSQTMTAASPVMEIDAEQFRISGATKVEDLVNQYPQLDMSFDNFANNGATTYATASLRGLGAGRTLTLVNGRRMPAGAFETTDLSTIPAAMVKRVDVLTGGASAVYGADAVAGVVNFQLNDEFEGVSVNYGYSAYQHNNENSYIQGLMDKAGFDYPTGSSGLDGVSRNLDLGVGGFFGDGGHAVAWVTWRENEALLQGQRDYSSCALSNPGTACGGSGTADPGNFLVGGTKWMIADGNGGYVPGQHLYNYAPINYYQRPDTRYTAGFMAKYEVNEHFEPYIETMFANRQTSIQIAESGTFGSAITVPCSTSYITSLCADAGITTDDVRIAMYKRNVEGGPRIQDIETQTYRIVAGVRGAITDNWSYDASYTYGRATWSNVGHNDFLFSRINDAAMGCPTGSFAGCVPYDIWNDNVSVEAAQALAGTSFQKRDTTYKAVNAFVTGDLGFGLPSANGENAGLVLGFERRVNTYLRQSDADSLAGNFAGAGGADTNLKADISVSELFMEAALPVIVGDGFVSRWDMEVGYRYSDYSTSGETNTYKFGTALELDETVLVRGSWNRAIRAPSLNNLYSPASMGLWGGNDPCAGATPTASAAACALTGVSAAQYGNIPASPADQYNGFFGGNAALEPETANTWTIGLAFNPIENLSIALDYFNIEVEDTISEIDPDTILNACITAQTLCDRIRRDPVTGDLWSGNSQNVDTAGMVFSQIGNNGGMRRSGIDLNVIYGWNAFGGRFNTTFNSTFMMKVEQEPVPGVVKYDCAGLINPSCGANPEWRFVSNLSYTLDRYSVNARWRYVGSSDYRDALTGAALTTDKLVAGHGGLKAANYFDLSGSVTLSDWVSVSLGVNNLFDREPPMVGGGLVDNGNGVAGYDQAGRYVFGSINLRF